MCACVFARVWRIAPFVPCRGLQRHGQLASLPKHTQRCLAGALLGRPSCSPWYCCTLGLSGCSRCRVQASSPGCAVQEGSPPGPFFWDTCVVCPPVCFTHTHTHTHTHTVHTHTHTHTHGLHTVHTHTHTQTHTHTSHKSHQSHTPVGGVLQRPAPLQSSPFCSLTTAHAHQSAHLLPPNPEPNPCLPSPDLFCDVHPSFVDVISAGLGNEQPVHAAPCTWQCVCALLRPAEHQPWCSALGGGVPLASPGAHEPQELRSAFPSDPGARQRDGVVGCVQLARLARSSVAYRMRQRCCCACARSASWTCAKSKRATLMHSTLGGGTGAPRPPLRAWHSFFPSPARACLYSEKELGLPVRCLLAN